MSRNILTITKWVPLQSEDHKNLFLECNQLKVSVGKLLDTLGMFLKEFQSANICKTYTISENELLIEKLENLVELIQSLVRGFSGAFGKLHINRPSLYYVKTEVWKKTLWTLKLKLCYFMQQLITEIAFLYVYYGEKLLNTTFRLSNTYNQYISLDSQFGITNSFTVCSNTCPYLMYPLRKVSITKLLQILAQNRAELCCHKLIDCLLDTYKLYESHEEDNGSDNSSIEIYRAITKHMSPPSSACSRKIKKDETVETRESESDFASMEELLIYEEQNVLDLLEVAVKEAPVMLGGDSIKKSKVSGETKINKKAKAKVLDYYQQILWGEVGNFLEHVILWWGALPLASRPPHSSQHLRDWITQFLPTIEVPPFIYSALTSLSDALGMHVTSTSWDQQFRLVLIHSKALYTPESGRLICEMLQNLVLLSNQCESTCEWILGAPLEELPLVEQIPILHRLDHSIHTIRLWALTETKRLANNWNAQSFFTITHCDIVNCLTQLSELKLANHSIQMEQQKLSAHVNVCANMRAKLVSEATENHQKLKDTRKQCIDILACVCRTVSLANLQMIFPNKNYYRRNDCVTNKESGYVTKYLDEILTPILAATDDHEISNMILKIMCESWLDYIYIHKVKFSYYGAYQLLTDFEAVSNWLQICPIINQHMRKKMLKNEVLRRCQGVGKLLLRSPGERLKMSETPKYAASEPESPRSDNTELMPPEMYVPNQEQWLALRAHRRRVFCSSLCCGEANF